MSLITFPTVRWDDYLVTFEADTTPLSTEEMKAVVVFAWSDGGFVLGKVPRGWCVPSGHIEPGETPEQTAVRETWEEIGGHLVQHRPIGRYQFVHDSGEVTRMPTFIGLVEGYGCPPPESESTGVMHATSGELRDHYWRWDALLESVFAFAESEIAANFDPHS